MSSHIEFLFQHPPPPEDVIDFLRERLPKINPSEVYRQEFVKESDISYYFTIGKLDTRRYRKFLMGVCKEKLSGIPVEICIDTDGDMESEWLKIYWDGKDFSFRCWFES